MKPIWLLVLSVAFTAAADALLYGADAGASLGALNLLNLALLFALGRLASPRARWLALAVGVLGLSHLFEPNLIALGLSLTGILALALLPRLEWPGDPRTWLRLGRSFLAGFAGQPFRDRRLLWGALRLPPAVMERDFLLPAGLGAAFVGLFLMANPLGDRALAELWDRIRYTEVPPFFRMVLWGALFTWAWGLARYLPSAAPPEARRRGEIGARAALRCLVLCNGLFLIQNASDALYLWGRSELPEGLTWAQYAHRGVYPLALSVLLAAGFVLRAGGRHRGLTLFWLFQSAVLAVSAQWRLALYIEEYGLSRWRLASALAIGFIVVGLGLMAWRLVKAHTSLWLLQRGTGAALGLCFLCAFADLDGAIAWHNVTRRGPVALDVGYLRHLGVQALPALSWYARCRGSEARRAVGELMLPLPRQLADWRSWTWARREGLRAWEASTESCPEGPAPGSPPEPGPISPSPDPRAGA